MSQTLGTGRRGGAGRAGPAALVATVPPVRTRAGTLRFTDASLLAPDAALLLLARLVTAEADTAERVALVVPPPAPPAPGRPPWPPSCPWRPTPRCDGCSWRSSPRHPEVATPALEAAAGDASALVRAAAARAIGGHPDGPRSTTCWHDSTMRRRRSGRRRPDRPAGWARPPCGTPWPRVEDDEAAVRLRAIRALQRPIPPGPRGSPSRRPRGTPTPRWPGRPTGPRRPLIAGGRRRPPQRHPLDRPDVRPPAAGTSGPARIPRCETRTGTDLDPARSWAARSSVVMNRLLPCALLCLSVACFPYVGE